MLSPNGSGIQRHLVRTTAGYVHVRTTGMTDHEQPALLFLHQVPASSRIWLPVMRELNPLSSRPLHRR